MPETNDYTDYSAKADFATDPAEFKAESSPSEAAPQAAAVQPASDAPAVPETASAAVSEPPPAPEKQPEPAALSPHEQPASPPQEPPLADLAAAAQRVYRHPVDAARHGPGPAWGTEHGERWHPDAHPSRLPPAARPVPQGGNR